MNLKKRCFFIVFQGSLTGNTQPTLGHTQTQSEELGDLEHQLLESHCFSNIQSSNDIWFFITETYSPEQLDLPKGEYSLQNFGCKYSVPCAFRVIANGI